MNSTINSFVTTMDEFTPIMKQYLSIKAHYKDAYLFFRMGDFYELFFDDAKTGAKLLSLTLTKRGKHKGEDIPMAGFPCNSLNTYIERLVNEGEKVVICEQIGSEKKNGLIDRKVVAFFSPGTFVAENYLTDTKNNYISCIYQHNDLYSISSLDISTGFFVTRLFVSKELFLDEIETLSPSEIVLSDTSNLSMYLNKYAFIQKKTHTHFNYNYAIKIFEKKLDIKFFNYKNLLAYEASIITAGCLLDHIGQFHKKNLENIMSINFVGTDGILDVDSNSKKNLEIFRSFKGEERDTLLNSLDFTTTPMGKRLLRRRLNTAIISRIILNNRKTAVSILKKNSIYEKLKEYLSNLFDLERIIGRIALNSAQPIDLKRLELSLNAIPQMRKILIQLKLNPLLFTILSNIANSKTVAALIKRAITDSPSSSIKEGSEIIKKGFDLTLDHLRDMLNNRQEYILKYQKNECARSGIDGLKIDFTPRLGFYIDLSNKINNVPNDYILVKTMANKNRYISSATKELENIFYTANDEAYSREKRLYNIILYLVKRKVKIIQNTAEHLAELDLLVSFATQASLYNWCEPDLVDECKLEIIDSRHPVVESKHYGTFVPNNITLDAKNKIFIITGANMGGKSTYMRQIAIITLLAHIGSHVPAKKAIIGKFDKILTRIGASDDLVNSCSTFMLEMKEVVRILEMATDKSLILIDEIGRGTGHNEGKALAASILKEFIIKKAYVLFSTHFNNLSKLFSSEHFVISIYSKVFYVNKKLIFLYKFDKGSSKNNFAIEVAEMAGLPKTIIDRAKIYLSEFEIEEQINYKKIIYILKNININSLSPEKALQALRIIKKLLAKHKIYKKCQN